MESEEGQSRADLRKASTLETVKIVSYSYVLVNKISSGVSIEGIAVRISRIVDSYFDKAVIRGQLK